MHRKVNLVLVGPGAVMLTPMMPMTMEFRVGTPIKIAAGAFGGLQDAHRCRTGCVG